jgi:hypothetical protein
MYGVILPAAAPLYTRIARTVNLPVSIMRPTKRDRTDRTAKMRSTAGRIDEILSKTKDEQAIFYI